MAPEIAPAVPTVNVCPATEIVVEPGIAALSGATEMELTPPLEMAWVVVVVSGWPAAAISGSSGGRSWLLTKPPFCVNPALKS